MYFINTNYLESNSSAGPLNKKRPVPCSVMRRNDGKRDSPLPFLSVCLLLVSFTFDWHDFRFTQACTVKGSRLYSTDKWQTFLRLNVGASVFFFSELVIHAGKIWHLFIGPLFTASACESHAQTFIGRTSLIRFKNFAFYWCMLQSGRFLLYFVD